MKVFFSHDPFNLIEAPSASGRPNFRVSAAGFLSCLRCRHPAPSILFVLRPWGKNRRSRLLTSLSSYATSRNYRRFQCPIPDALIRNLRPESFRQASGQRSLSLSQFQAPCASFQSDLAYATRLLLSISAGCCRWPFYRLLRPSFPRVEAEILPEDDSSAHTMYYSS